MKKPSLRLFALIGLEVIGAALAIVLAFGGWMVWQAERGDVDLAILQPVIHRAVEARLPAPFDVQTGRIRLHSQRQSGRTGSSRYRITIDDLSVRHREGTAAVYTPRLVFWLDKRALRDGARALRRLHSDQLVVTVSEQAFDNVQAPQGADLPALTKIISQLKDAALESALEEVRIDEIDLVFSSARSQLTVMDGQFAYNKAASLFKLSLPVQTGAAAGELSVRMGQKENGVTGTGSGQTLRLTLYRFPAASVIAHFARTGNFPLSVPITGDVTARLTRDGAITDAAFNLTGAPGTLQAGATEMRVEGLTAIGSYNDEDRKITLDRFDISSPALTTALSGTATLNPDAVGVFFDLYATQTRLVMPSFFAEPFEADTIKAVGTFHGRRHIVFDRLAVDIGDIGFAGAFAMQNHLAEDGSAQSPGMQGALKTTGRIDKQRLMALWPLTLAPRARSWVNLRIKKGYAENLDFSIDMGPGEKSSLGFIPNDSLSLDFDVASVEAEIIPGMTPLRGAGGRGRLYGNKLEIDVDRAKAGPVQFFAGTVELPQFSPRGGGQVFSFSAHGDAADMMRLINEKPLSLLDASGLQPAQISGDAEVTLSVTRRPDWMTDKPRFSYEGAAQFENLILLEAWQDLDLTDAAGTMALSDQGLSISGNAKLGVTPVNISWSQDFTATRDPSRLTLSGRFDASTADLLGIPTRSVLAGPVDLAVDARGRYRTFSRLDIAADFSDATLTLDDLAWRKLPGVLTALNLTIRYDADGRQTGQLSVDGDGLDIQGTYSLFANGRLASLTMPVVAIDRYADFSFEASRARGQALEALASGTYINLGPVVERFLANPDLGSGRDQDTDDLTTIEWGRGMNARLRFDRLALRNDIALSDAALDLVHDSEKLTVLNLSGFDADRRPLSVILSTDERDTGVPARRTVLAETTNIGDLMRGIFGLTSLQGGAGQMTLTLADTPGGPIGGMLAARGLQVVNAPMLAKLFAAGSFEALADLMSDQGIALQSVDAQFAISDGKIRIRQANAVGPSVGLSAAGVIGLDGTGVALAGALAPIYQINAVLGNAPLIGPLLVNRKGEGLLAVSYEITGEVMAPLVTIKPLSALAPGVLRRAFENDEFIPENP
ncbi:MAG: DUF3971 domain-containing protein [Pseudomonadota bacterium]